MDEQPELFKNCKEEVIKTDLKSKGYMRENKDREAAALNSIRRLVFSNLEKFEAAGEECLKQPDIFLSNFALFRCEAGQLRDEIREYAETFDQEMSDKRSALSEWRNHISDKIWRMLKKENIFAHVPLQPFAPSQAGEVKTFVKEDMFFVLNPQRDFATQFVPLDQSHLPLELWSPAYAQVTNWRRWAKDNSDELKEPLSWMVEWSGAFIADMRKAYHCEHCREICEYYYLRRLFDGTEMSLITQAKRPTDSRGLMNGALVAKGGATKEDDDMIAAIFPPSLVGDNEYEYKWEKNDDKMWIFVRKEQRVIRSNKSPASPWKRPPKSRNDPTYHRSMSVNPPKCAAKIFLGGGTERTRRSFLVRMAFEDKNETGKDGWLQAGMYAVYHLAGGAKSNLSNRPLFIVVVQGQVMRIGGALCQLHEKTGDKRVTASIFHTIDLSRTMTQDVLIEVATFFSCLRDALVRSAEVCHILAERETSGTERVYQIDFKMPGPPKSYPMEQSVFPPRRGYSDGEQVKTLTYVRVIVSHPDGATFLAKEDGGEERSLIVKIQSDTYGKWAHQAFANEELAPRLICCESYGENSRFQFIVMDAVPTALTTFELTESDDFKSLYFLIGAFSNGLIPSKPDPMVANTAELDSYVLGLLHSSGDDIIWENATKNLDTVQQLLEKNDLRHGDLRTCNVLMNVAGKIQIIDFGHASASENEAPKYPMMLNAEAVEEFCWADGEAEVRKARGCEVSRKHDELMINRLKVKLKDAEGSWSSFAGGGEADAEDEEQPRKTLRTKRNLRDTEGSDRRKEPRCDTGV